LGRNATGKKKLSIEVMFKSTKHELLHVEVSNVVIERNAVIYQPA
jgi:hypothetical protein